MSATESKLLHVFWYVLGTVEASQTNSPIFDKGKSSHDFLKFLVLFRREMWTLVEVTLRKELAARAHALHRVPSLAEEVVF